MLSGEEPTRTPPPVDHFIHNEEDSVLVTDAADLLPVGGTGNVTTHGSADRLADEGGHRLRALELDFLLEVPGRHQVPFGAVQTEIVPIVVDIRNVGHPIHEWSEERLCLGAVAADAHGAERRPVVTTTAGDDLVSLRESPEKLDLLGDLEGRLNRFRPATAEEGSLEVPRGQFCDARRKLSGGDRGVVARAHVGQLTDLGGGHLRDLGASVPDVHHDETGHGVDVTASMDIEQVDTLAPLEHAEPLTLGEIPPAR